MNYYYLKNGETLGPLPIDDLVKIIDENTLVWSEDGSMNDWVPAKELSGLANSFKERKAPNIIVDSPRTDYNRKHIEPIQTRKFNHWIFLLIIVGGILISELIIGFRLNFEIGGNYIHVDYIISGLVLLITTLVWIINYRKYSIIE